MLDKLYKIQNRKSLGRKPRRILQPVSSHMEPNHESEELKRIIHLGETRSRLNVGSSFNSKFLQNNYISQTLQRRDTHSSLDNINTRDTLAMDSLNTSVKAGNDTSGQTKFPSSALSHYKWFTDTRGTTNPSSAAQNYPPFMSTV